MAEQLKLILRCEESTFTSGMPIITLGYSLFVERKSGLIFVQIDFLSMYDSKIIELEVDIFCRDVEGKAKKSVKGVVFKELFRNRDQKFGENNMIELPEKDTRSIEVFIKKTVFYDGTRYETKADAQIVAVPLQKRLEDFFDDERYAGQYRRQTNLSAEYIAVDFGEKWVCSCGAFNNFSETACHKCMLKKEHLNELLDKQKLEAGLKIFEKECRENERRQQKEKTDNYERHRKKKTRVKLLILTGVLITAVVLILFTIIIPNIKYKNAMDMYGNLQYHEAAEEFYKLNEYKDSLSLYKYLNEQRLLLKYGITENYGEEFEFNDLRYLRDAGELYTLGLIEAEEGTAGIKTDGTAFAFAVYTDVEQWSNIIEISSGFMHVAGLRGDGTVIVAGQNHDVNDWDDIIAVRTGAYHTVGLKADGTVVAAGKNEFGQCDVESWSNIIAIYANSYATLGLKWDGTIVVAGQNKYGELNVESWTGVKDIAVYGYLTIGLREDGTVFAAGENEKGQCNINEWTDIAFVAAGNGFVVGLKEDGTVMAVGNNDKGQCKVDDWNNIIMISAGRHHILGLKSDGTIIAAGSNDYGQCSIEGWNDIVYIDAGELHTVAIKADGIVLAVGKNNLGECLVNGMDLW